MKLPSKSIKCLDNLPQHIAFIMDGNGRWAKKRGLPRKFGHKEGAKTFKKIVDYCKKIGVKYISFYAFSTENWKRPQDEVDAIMELFRQYLLDVREHIGQEVRVIFIGDKGALPQDIQQKMVELEEDSKGFDKMTLLLAINYGGRAEIINCIKKLSDKISRNIISADSITEEIVSNNLYTAGVPDVDLMIRPSGEQRISNFLIWQCAYAELYFTNVLWPDFSTRDLDKALVEYTKRTRRFGGV